MNRKMYALRAAQSWRGLALSATQFRDMFANRGDEVQAEFWQHEYEIRTQRATYWQNLADGPAWRRWFG